jgi:hypothetical protein
VSKKYRGKCGLPLEPFVGAIPFVSWGDGLSNVDVGIKSSTVTSLNVGGGGEDLEDQDLQ